MSTAALNWAFKLQDVPSGQKFVLVALADSADDAGWCFPGQKYVAAKTGQSERTVRQHMAWLEEAGLINRQRRLRQDGTRTSDLIRVRSEPPEESAGGGGLPAGFAEPTGEKPLDLPAKSAGQEPLEEPLEEPSDSTVRSNERPVDDNETVFQGKLLYLKRKQLRQFIKKYDCLPQADIIDFLQRLDQAWTDGAVDKPPKDTAEAFMRAQKWLARKNREAFMRAKDQGGEFVTDQTLRDYAAEWALQAAADGEPVWAKFEVDEPYRKLIAAIGKKRFVIEFIKMNWENGHIEKITGATIRDGALTPEKGDAMLDELQKGLRLNKGEQLTRWWHKELVE